MTPGLTILNGDWIEQLRPLPDESVHCVVTSPPYFGLRDYKVTGQFGLETTIEAYIDKFIEGFRELRRVLRDDGTVWLNLGDSYANDGKWGGHTGGKHVSALHNSPIGRNKKYTGLKPKDLVGIPWRVALAMQADGWWLRSDIIWHKPNPMPESTTDRPTKSHEYIFLLTKSESYFYDLEAIKETSSPNTNPKLPGNVRPPKGQAEYENGDRQRTKAGLLNYAVCVMLPTRNSRSVWTITTEPFKGAHFATFPSEIPRRCILAGTSAKGACADCGAPWERIVGMNRTFESGSGKAGNLPVGKNGAHMQGGGETKDIRRGPVIHSETLGWQPTCECHGELVRGKITIPARMTADDVGQWGADQNGEYLGLSTKDHAAHGVQDASAIKARIIRNATQDREVTGWIYQSDLPLDKHPIKPCVVLDPFGGSGTTGQVALELGRHCTLIELNPEYVKLIEQRCHITPGLPSLA